MHKALRTIQSIRYHGNGVTGAGFHVVRFTDHATHKPLIGIVFAQDPGSATSSSEYIGVLDPADPDSRFAHEWYAYELERACWLWQHERGRCLIELKRDIADNWTPSMKLVRDWSHRPWVREQAESAPES
jgi:hypothetical protein